MSRVDSGIASVALGELKVNVVPDLAHSQVLHPHAMNNDTVQLVFRGLDVADASAVDRRIQLGVDLVRTVLWTAGRKGREDHGGDEELVEDNEVGCLLG